jgi:hypothetical protein
MIPQRAPWWPLFTATLAGMLLVLAGATLGPRWLIGAASRP